MLENKISSILVVDINNKKELKGIITKSDLVNTYSTYYKERYSVEEYMTEEVLTLTPDEPIHMVLLLMIKCWVILWRGKIRRTL